MADAATPVRPPRTPTLYRTPSKKDLHKQKKLLRRVSDLEGKLASARKELQTVLHNDDLPPVPPLPTLLPPTPNTSQSDNEASSPQDAGTPVPSPHRTGKITKKRKAATDDGDADFKPIATDSDGDVSLSAPSEPERTIKRVKSTASRKNARKSQPSSSSSSSRLQKRRSSRNSMTMDEVVVTVVPDGVLVPPIPSLPRGVKGKKVPVRGDDGYGGLEHEMF